VPRLGDALGVEPRDVDGVRPDVVLVQRPASRREAAPVASTIRVVELPTDRLDDALRAVDEIGD